MSPDHGHLDFDYLDIQGLSSSRNPHQSLLQLQHSHPHEAATAEGINPSAPIFSFYSSLIVCGASVVVTA
jgi:hypothetical protein